MTDTDRGLGNEEGRGRRTAALLEAVPWGDVEGQLVTLRQALRLAMEATSEEFSMWESHGQGEALYGDEFSLSPGQVTVLDDVWRLAYVGRLVRTIALMVGAGTEFSSDCALGELESDRRSIGWLVQYLADIETGSRA